MANAAQLSVERAAYTINEFCLAHRLCRAQLYRLWKVGCGPRYIRNGVRRIITVEAAAEWRRDREAESNAGAAR
jgi:hypothetical protein